MVSPLVADDSGNGCGRCDKPVDSRRHCGDDNVMDIEGLGQMVGRLHGCEAAHLETVPVTEKFQGQIVWQGEVEVFRLRGHPKATRCYAWSHASGADDQTERVVTVLELPPVTSAQTAVRAAIVDEYRRQKNDASKET